MADNYTLERGTAGARRLHLLGRAMWPSTRAFLQRAGVRPGLRCLDVGCGIGSVSIPLARRSGHCLGIDLDPDFLQLARARAARSDSPALFQPGNAKQLELGQEFDLVFARYLLSHQTDPQRVLTQMVATAAPGGLVAVEDVDFPGHFWHPECAAMPRYLEVYQKVVASRGGNACLGRELPRMFRAAGLEDIRIKLVVSVHQQGLGKRIAELTLLHISEAAAASGVACRGELSRLGRQLKQFRRLPESLVSIAPTFQVMGHKRR